MKITQIELAGSSKATLSDGSPGLPRAFARISRRNGEDQIKVELLAPGQDKTWYLDPTPDPGPANASSPHAADLYPAAMLLQETLDGRKGTNSDVQEYFNILLRFAD